MDDQYIWHIRYQMLEILVFPFTAIALHLDRFGLAVQLDAGLKLYELLLSWLLDIPWNLIDL